jgi:RNA polymerase sigma-70 factor (ECF subfamily)
VISLINKKFTISTDLQKYIYETYFNQVFKIALSITRDISLSEEICQETFMTCFQKYYQLKDPQKTGPWLSTITFNISRSMLKKKSKIIPMALEEIAEINNVEHNTPESIYQTYELQEELLYIVGKLPVDLQEVVILKYYHDLEITEIAEMIGIPNGTVKSRLFCARQKLKEIIENNEILLSLKLREG